MKRLPFGKSKVEQNGRPKSNRVSPWTNSKPRPVSMPVPDTAPSLPPLLFDLEFASASTFSLGDILVDTESKELPSLPFYSSSSGLPIPPAKDSPSTQPDSSLLKPRSRRGSSSTYAGNRLGTINEIHPLRSEPVYSKVEDSSSMAIPTSSKKEDDTKATNAELTIQELKMELAKYNPMSPLLHGAPQQEYGLLLQKSKRLRQQHSEMEEALQELHVKKDLMVMDLDATEVALETKEAKLLKISNNKTKLPRASAAHLFMKRTYQAEVKELRDQKVQLREEIQGLTGQRDEILNEMQILSVRNMELMNDTLASEQPWQPDSKPRSGYASSVKSASDIISSFTEKIRRPRAGSSSESNPLAGGNNSRSSISSRLSTSDDLDEETMAWRNNRRKSTKSTGVGAMIGKLLESTSSSGANLEVSQTQALLRQSQDEGEGRSSGQHYFVLYNFVRPVRCNGCEEMLWGREFKCQYCGYQSHGKCTQFSYAECRRSSSEDPSRNVSHRSSSDHEFPPVPSKHIMFGNDLQDQVEREQRMIPLVVGKCIEAMDMRGLEVEGIYRRSGMAAESRKLVEAFNNDHPPDLTDPGIYQDVCSITSVLKQYLRSLPEPLIPSSLYDNFMSAIDLPSHEAQLYKFRKLVDRMPEAHFQTMKALMEHLNRVTQNSSINLMNAKNLSVVFGPTLMRNPDPSQEMVDVTYQNLAIEFLILHTDELFADRITTTNVQDSQAIDDNDEASDDGTEISSFGEEPVADSPTLERSSPFGRSTVVDAS
ncbi:hypothetical protein BGZ52_012136 [Haplosporangium bisporale]|nr:hypothetical protein BGZ52_012136 [Haplosporangium bisporale]